MRKLFLLFVFPLVFFSCKNKDKNEVRTDRSDRPDQPEIIVSHPDWIKQGNVYEVNVRQYTPEGTLNAFGKHLDRLKEMGVQTLWFMPIHPISKVDRKGSKGSYYAVADYQAVNPEFGTMEDWKRLVDSIHAKGMKVIIDWVPNHSGADHPWIEKKPDYYVADSTGKPSVAFDWNDVRQLNFKNPEFVDSMIAAMKFWIKETGIDGYRVDVAWNVPEEFWKKSVPELKKLKSDFFLLAEGDKPYLMTSGFNAYYPWEMFHKMVKVAAGQAPAFALDSIKQKYDTTYPESSIPLYFTSNHDENSWNKSDYGTFPGPVHAPFAVFTQTMDGALPLIYSGQEEPLLRKLEFFEKDPIKFGKFGRAEFYKTLLGLRKNNEALSIDASFRKVSVGNDSAIYAFTRAKNNKKILVILNLSKKEQPIQLKDKSLHGNVRNVFKNSAETLSDKPWKMSAWGYAIYEYN